MSSRNGNNYRGGGGNYAAQAGGGKQTLIKAIAVLLCVLAAGYVIASLALGFVRKTSAPLWNPIDWFKGSSAAQGDTGDVLGDGTDGSRGKILNVIESNGIALAAAQIPAAEYAAYAIPDDTENAYLITATVEPKDSIDKRLGWAVSWKDGGAAWAQGKRASDYMDATPVEEYSAQATLTCKAAFGEPINLTIYSISDAGVNCTVQLDYVKHLNSFEVLVNPDMPDVAQAAGTPNAALQRNVLLTGYGQPPAANNVSITPHFGVGTVEGYVSKIEVTFRLSDSMKNGLKSALSSAAATIKDGVTVSSSVHPSAPMPTFYLMVSNFFSYSTANADVLANNFFCNAAVPGTAPNRSGSGMGSFDYDLPTEWTVTYTFGSVYKQTVGYWDYTPYRLCNDGLKTVATVTGITPDKDNVVFY